MQKKSQLFKGLGFFLIFLFFLSVFFAIAICPPWRCGPELQVAYFLPFSAFFSVLPLGLLFLVIGRFWVDGGDNGSSD